LAEEHRRLLQTLGDEVLVQIAEWKLEGWTGGEIADKLGLSRRSTERKLERIRECWKRELKA
jgi:DNA-directed RNA polymerase specialized sigma24 family protein